MFKAGTYVEKINGDYGARGRIVGDPIDIGDNAIRHMMAIEHITRGRLLHIVNPKHLVGTNEPVTHGWLIRRKSKTPNAAWQVYLMGYMDGDFCWTASSVAAMVFYRKEDAYKFIDNFVKDLAVDFVSLAEIINGS